MKAELPKPEHYSYQLHRKQVGTQILLPVILAGVLIVALTVVIILATFRGGGDVGRWAAISTMWISVPVLIFGLLGLVVAAGLIYLLARLLDILPTYTGLAQDYVYKARGYIIHAADMAVRPIIAINTFMSRVKAFFGRD
ncbi:MAG: hypothetical protein AB1649_26445 [Chloroflexota bacterium]